MRADEPHFVALACSIVGCEGEPVVELNLLGGIRLRLCEEHELTWRMSSVRARIAEQIAAWQRGEARAKGTGAT
jgi:hypothetical protein